jgi:UDP-N-acetylglucosamine 4-epimerase
MNDMIISNLQSTAMPAIQPLLARHEGLWLVTGVAGFIGSNLLEALLHCGQRVRGLDNFATGHQRNLDEVEALVGKDAWSRFEMIVGDIRDRQVCSRAVDGVDHVLHQAALGSVPRSLEDPVTVNEVNVGGFLKIMDAARRAGVRSFVYASSSSAYGDEPNLPKIEAKIGDPLSPYAVTKRVDEMYADVYRECYGFLATGLRYFNVFGPRQDPDGAYAAVIPKWTNAMIEGRQVVINGDGETSRDFCFVANVVQMNIRASLAAVEDRSGVYNVAFGDRTTLNQLFAALRLALATCGVDYGMEPGHCDFRVGDIHQSLADVSKARSVLGYEPTHDIVAGLTIAIPWYVAFCR